MKGMMDIEARIARALVVRPDDRLGNVVLTTGLVAALRRALPDAEIDWLVPRRFAPLVADNPHRVRVLGFEKRWLFRAPWKWAAFLAELGNRRYDLTIDASHEHVVSRTGLWLTRWSGAPLRVGHARGGVGRHYTHVVSPADAPTHELTRKHRLLRALFPEIAPAPPWIGRLPSPATKRIDAWLNESGLDGRSFVVLWPGSRKADRRRPWREYVELMKRRRDEGIAVVIGWGPGEENVARAIAAELAAPLAPDMNPMELAALVMRSCGYAGNDTGPLHLAFALGRRTFSLMPDAETATRWGYEGGGHRAVLVGSSGLGAATIREALDEWLAALAAEGRRCASSS